MSWFRSKKKSSDNELGDYLPEDDAQQYEQSEPIQAYNKEDAEEKCDELAASYGGTEPEVEHTGRKGEYDCKFKLWG